MAVQRKKPSPQTIEVEATIEEQFVPIVISDLKPEKLSEVTKLREKVNEVVKANPFVEIDDNASLKKAIAHRKALRDVSIEVESQDKWFGTFLTGFRKTVKTILIGDEENDGINEISRTPFNKQDEEIKRFEAIIEERRIENARIAQERADGIKADIDAVIADATSLFDDIKLAHIATIEAEVNSLIGKHKGTFEEFDVLYEEKVAVVLGQLEAKIQAVTKAAEEAEANRKSTIQSKIREIENEGKSMILAVTNDDLEELKFEFDSLMGVDFDFAEYLPDFKKLVEELNSLWQKAESRLAQEKEMLEFRFEKRSKLLLDLGMTADEHGGFFFEGKPESKITKQMIVAPSNDAFDTTFQMLADIGKSIKEWIDESEVAATEIDETEQEPAEAIIGVDTGDGDDYSVETTFENGEIVNQEVVSEKPDYIAMAEAAKAEGFVQEEETPATTPEYRSNAAEQIGTVGNVGELIMLLENIDPHSTFKSPLKVYLLGDDRVYFTE